jgi:hypothetical protein
MAHDTMSTYDVLKDFAGPVATVIASIAAGFVAYMLGSRQVDIAREQARFAKANSRSTQQKLVLDLFDKRWDVTTAIRDVVSEVFTSGHVSQAAVFTFHRACNRAALLFGPEVQTYLKKVENALTKHQAANSWIDSEIDGRRNKGADIQFEQFEIIKGFYDEFDPLVAPYMLMHAKSPD